jgi:hypothetical protein
VETIQSSHDKARAAMLEKIKKHRDAVVSKLCCWEFPVLLVDIFSVHSIRNICRRMIKPDPCVSVAAPGGRGGRNSFFSKFALYFCPPGEECAPPLPPQHY